MLKLIKYEFKKNLAPVLIFLAALVFVELIFIIGNTSDNEDLVVIAISLLLLAGSFSYFLILLFGISSYSKELKNKTIYLVFMTPNSTLSIIMSKLIHITLTALMLAAAFIGTFAIDFHILIQKFSDTTLDIGEVFDVILKSYNTSVATLIATTIFYIISIVIIFLTYVVMGYLSVTLSATILNNSKAKGFLSAVFFVIFLIINSVIVHLLPTIIETPYTTADILINLIPQLIVEIIAMVLMIWGTSYMLEKKISL